MTYLLTIIFEAIPIRRKKNTAQNERYLHHIPANAASGGRSLPGLKKIPRKMRATCTILTMGNKGYEFRCSSIEKNGYASYADYWQLPYLMPRNFLTIIV